MDDRCTITRDPTGNSDAVLDPNTLKLTAPDPDDVGIVYSGACKVRSVGLGTRDNYRDFGGQAVISSAYVGSIPLSAPVPSKGDLLRITASRRDPALVGRVFIVSELAYSTLSVSRRFLLELRQ